MVYSRASALLAFVAATAAFEPENDPLRPLAGEQKMHMDSMMSMSMSPMGMSMSMGMSVHAMPSSMSMMTSMGMAMSAAAPACVVPESNPCAGAKPVDAQFTDANGVLDESRTISNYFDNRNCSEMMDTGFAINLPQAGMDVTVGAGGDIDLSGGAFMPILEDYSKTDLCPVNVHWHLGTEHRSAGQFDENGSGPGGYSTSDLVAGTHYDQTYGTKAAGSDGVRLGLQCHHYDANDTMYTTPYDFQYCKDMTVGQTYEVHWPHSAAGACGTQWQYQYPFYDGVFCMPGIISLGDNPPFNVPAAVGVQGQVFVIVNDESPEYKNNKLFHGAWQDDTHWVDVAKYIGSTTGTSRDNEVCSMYAPITWQVDRTCHKISASSFDEMCRYMYNQADDMSEDMHPHGARELVAPEWAVDTIYRKAFGI